MIRPLLPFALLLSLASCVAAPELVPLGTNASTSPTQTIYRQAFVGRYSPSPICAGQDLQVELAPESVYLGETGCNIARVERTSGGVLLALNRCRAEGRRSPTDAERHRKRATAPSGSGRRPCRAPSSPFRLNNSRGARVS